MNDQATLLKWAQQLPASPYGKEACAKLLEAVSQQRLALPAIHQAGLLQPLCVALRTKDAPAQQRAVAVLLEASRCGPGGEVELAAVPGCCQALLDLVATNMPPVHNTVFEATAAATAGSQQQQQQQQQGQQQQGQQQGRSQGGAPVEAQPGGTAAAAAPAPGSPDGSPSGGAAAAAAVRQSGSSNLGKQQGPQPPASQQGPERPAAQPALNAWEEPHAAARAACSLLWRISADSEGRELLMAGTSGLVQVLMVLLGTPSVALRMAASGALFNLSQETRVQWQLVARAQELVPILVGLLGRAGPDLQATLAACAGGGGGSLWSWLANAADSASASASGRTSPDVSPRHSALLAAAPPPNAARCSTLREPGPRS
ncbi:hypothetical protein PLESTM_000796200, partial [Pleodorina starrii]